MFLSIDTALGFYRYCFALTGRLGVCALLESGLRSVAKRLEIVIENGVGDRTFYEVGGHGVTWLRRTHEGVGRCTAARGAKLEAAETNCHWRG